jgi:hypothetical protein
MADELAVHLDVPLDLGEAIVGMTDENLLFLAEFVDIEVRRRNIVAKADERLRALGIEPDTDLTPEGDLKPEVKARRHGS